MKKINIDKPLNESLNNRKSKDRAIEVFIKLLAEQKRPKNPFDELRTTSYPIKEDVNPGVNPNDPV